MRPLIAACVLTTALGQTTAYAQQYQFGNYGGYDYSTGVPGVQFQPLAVNPYGYQQYPYSGWQQNYGQAGYGASAGQTYPYQPVYPYPQAGYAPTMQAPAANIQAAPYGYPQQYPAAPAYQAQPRQFQSAPVNNQPATTSPAAAGRGQPVNNNAPINGGKFQPATKVGAEQKTSTTPNLSQPGTPPSRTAAPQATGTRTITPQTSPATGANQFTAPQGAPVRSATPQAAPAPKGAGAVSVPGNTHHISDEFELAPIVDRNAASATQPRSHTQLPDPRW